MSTQTQAGYKGHRKGTMKEKAHQFFDANKGKLERPDVIKRIMKMGATEGTAATWYQTFKRTKPAKAKKAGAKKSSKSKKTVH